MKIQKLKSSKLFFNKWPYKIECTIFGAHLLKVGVGFPKLKSWCLDPVRPLTVRHTYGTKNVDKTEFLKFIECVEPIFNNENIKIRIEGTAFNIFCNDINQVVEINETLKKWIRNIYGPETQEEYNFLMSNGHKKRLCDNLPKGKYQYQLFFKETMDDNIKNSFLKWAEKYQDSIHFSNTTKDWFSNKRYWMQSPFIYITDSKMLSMICMFLGNNIRRIDEFIVRNRVLMA